MRGLVLEGVGRVALHGDLPDPSIEAPTDAVVAVHQAGLCGSDLHPYEGRELVRFGVVPGHEVVGRVVAVGAQVATIAVGDRVIVPFSTSCGGCGPCRRDLTARCTRGALFGFAPSDGAIPALPGGQAEFVRVPWADGTLVPVPTGLDERCAVLLTDNLPTAWCAVERADLPVGATIVVVGLGAVGLCAVAVARWRGAEMVIGIDPVAARRDRAAHLGAIVATPEAAGAQLAAVGATREGAPGVVEAAGTPAAQALAFSLLRRGGTLSVIAVQTADRFGFTPLQAYDANVSVRFGRASVRAALDRLLPVVADDVRALADVVITDPDVPLADGPAVYARFARRTGGIVKAVFTP